MVKRKFTKKQIAIGSLFIIFIFLTSTLFITLNQVGKTQDLRQKAAEPENQNTFGKAESFENLGNATTQDLTASTQGTCDATYAGLDSEEKKMLQLINQFRQENGLSPFQNSQKLNIMSSNLAEDYATNGYDTTHTDSQGRGLQARFTACGITPTSGSENTGQYPTTEQMFNGWKTSTEGHRENMLSNRAAIGVARIKSGNNWIWATDFATPNPGGTPTDDNSQPQATSTPTKTPTNPPSQTTATTTPTTFPGTITPTTTTATPTLPQNQTSAVFQILLQGIGPDGGVRGFNPNPKRPTRTLNYEILNSKNEVIKSGNAQLTAKTYPQLIVYEGASPLGSILPQDLYTARVKFDNTLWKKLSTQLQGNTLNVSSQELVLGDINQDNALNLLDYNIILSCFGSKTCSQKVLSDLDDNGVIDEKDLNIFYYGLAKQSGD